MSPGISTSWTRTPPILVSAGHRPERRERVVAGLDLDLGECLQERRLADVRRPDQGDLGGAFAAHRDRVTVDGVRPDPRVLDLRQQPLAQVRVRTVPVVGQLARCSAWTSRIRSRPSLPVSRRFATWANVRCGIGIAISLRCMGTARRQQRVGAALAARVLSRPFLRRWFRKGRLSRSCWRWWRARRRADAGPSGWS